MAATYLTLVTFVLFSLILGYSNALSVDYYHQTCPMVESTIQEAVKKAMMNDNTVPAALLRMHFHDCFVRGCDASVLLNTKGKNKAEKDGPPNISLHAFYVIDNTKMEVEAQCPGVVSCADILALAARDAVSLQSFSQRGLSMDDLVALSGGHNLGFSHCSSFQNRIHNFNTTTDIDPSIHPSFAASLRQICPTHNKVKNAGFRLDSSPTTFDNTYYKLLLQGKSLFSSDQALLTTTRTKSLVAKFARSQEEFEKAFVKSMIKMSSINGGTEIRKDCRFVRGANSISMTEQNTTKTHKNLEIPDQETLHPGTEKNPMIENKQVVEEEELKRLLVPNVEDLPPSPPSAVESNFTTYFLPDFFYPGNDQYVHRHANGLCVIGLAPYHVAFKDELGISNVSFDVGRTDRSTIKVTGKRKKNAQHLHENTALCKVFAGDVTYIARCCVKGSLLEVNERLIKHPQLLNSSANREGYIAIIMPKPADWLKAKASMLSFEEYQKLRDLLII
ncbi:peroxidase 64 [Olea europaea subsp. europaea]|uniref:peroxidase n=2 Tax=Olea europaea subsp. europaea TaxID=158383 RepID=A0A8S0UKV2_OLEEU|nr:peroxidase 64 [Olea europaea subsp. europaea]